MHSPLARTGRLQPSSLQEATSGALSPWGESGKSASPTRSQVSTEDGLDDEAETLDEALEQLTDAARTIAAVLVSGTQTIAEITQLDPELGVALHNSSTCTQLREETER